MPMAWQAPICSKYHGRWPFKLYCSDGCFSQDKIKQISLELGLQVLSANSASYKECDISLTNAAEVRSLGKRSISICIYNHKS